MNFNDEPFSTPQLAKSWSEILSGTKVPWLEPDSVLAMELEMLGSIYGDEASELSLCQYNQDDGDSPLVLGITCLPRTGGDPLSTFVKLRLELAFPPGYPSAAAAGGGPGGGLLLGVRALRSLGLGDAGLAAALGAARAAAAAAQAAGGGGALPAVEAAADALDALNGAGECGCCLGPLFPPGGGGGGGGGGAAAGAADWGSAARAPCYHAFHRACLARWWLRWEKEASRKRTANSAELQLKKDERDLEVLEEEENVLLNELQVVKQFQKKHFQKQLEEELQKDQSDPTTRQRVRAARAALAGAGREEQRVLAGLRRAGRAAGELRRRIRCLRRKFDADHPGGGRFQELPCPVCRGPILLSELAPEFQCQLKDLTNQDEKDVDDEEETFAASCNAEQYKEAIAALPEDLAEKLAKMRLWQQALFEKQAKQGGIIGIQKAEDEAGNDGAQEREDVDDASDDLVPLGREVASPPSLPIPSPAPSLSMFAAQPPQQRGQENPKFRDSFQESRSPPQSSPQKAYQSANQNVGRPDENTRGKETTASGARKGRRQRGGRGHGNDLGGRSERPGRGGNNWAAEGGRGRGGKGHTTPFSGDSSIDARRDSEGGRGRGGKGHATPFSGNSSIDARRAAEGGRGRGGKDRGTSFSSNSSLDAHHHQASTYEKRGRIGGLQQQEQCRGGRGGETIRGRRGRGKQGRIRTKGSPPPPNNDEGLPLHNCLSTGSPKNIEPSDASTRKAETTEKRKTTAENNDVSTNKS